VLKGDGPSPDTHTTGLERLCWFITGCVGAQAQCKPKNELLRVTGAPPPLLITLFYRTDPTAL